MIQTNSYICTYNSKTDALSQEDVSRACETLRSLKAQIPDLTRSHTECRGKVLDTYELDCQGSNSLLDYYLTQDTRGWVICKHHSEIYGTSHYNIFLYGSLPEIL